MGCGFESGEILSSGPAVVSGPASVVSGPAIVSAAPAIVEHAEVHAAPEIACDGPRGVAPPAVPASIRSRVEDLILNSAAPAPLNGRRKITVNGESGLFVNEDEVASFRGEWPISKYPINRDPNPRLIQKAVREPVNFLQEIAVKFLQPPPPPPPGPIIIRHAPNQPTGPAPPIIIRQCPPPPCNPPPIVVRERPPCPPPPICRRDITLPGRPLPPPPRKVIIERLPQEPPRPPPICVERWLPYGPRERRVIKHCPPPDPAIPVPKNLIIQWAPLQASVRRAVRVLGIRPEDPARYLAKYGSSLNDPSQMPAYARGVRPPNGGPLAAEAPTATVPRLVGDVPALSCIDLEAHGLGEYRPQVPGGRVVRRAFAAPAVVSAAPAVVSAGPACVSSAPAVVSSAPAVVSAAPAVFSGPSFVSAASGPAPCGC